MEDEVDMSFDDVCEALQSFGEGATNELMLELIQTLSEQLEALRLEIQYLRQAQQQMNSYPLVKTTTGTGPGTFPPYTAPYYGSGSGGGMKTAIYSSASSISKYDPNDPSNPVIMNAAGVTEQSMAHTHEVFDNIMSRWITDAVKKHIPTEEEL